MSDEEDILRKITEKFGESVLEARVLGRRRISILVPPDAYKNVVKYVAQDLGLEFLSCLSGVDYGDSLEVVAHLGFSTQILIKTRVPKNNPVIDSITDILPAANLYEREAHDLLGIIFRGHPNLRRVFLPEDWPKGIYPLRKDYAPEHPKPLRGGEVG
ncbi:MAG: NADH-quinone oxidoreductase subunit C [Thaumarchaeota archaeon]|nr:NADH-quinone oxidoreductase subunit C [Candidatus Wolframiiraptor allenii]